MSLIVVSTYDQGRPPLDAVRVRDRIARHASAVTLVDLSVGEPPPDSFAEAGAVLFYVPMHTALRLAIAAARTLRAKRPSLPIGFFGLYAALQRTALQESGAQGFGPEEEALAVDWMLRHVPEAARRRGDDGGVDDEAATGFAFDLSRYAHLVVGEERRMAGAVAATRGCLHRCLHCPVPLAYQGRIRLNQVDEVVRMVDTQVDAGMRHLSFTDPDFLNAPSHAQRMVAAIHARHPDMTFDCTVKVEHILRHAHLWAWLAERGCLFVISAFESVDDETLEILAKGHTAADEKTAVTIVRAAGIEIRPSFLPFLPWTTMSHITELFDFVAEHDLVESVDPVQYSVRLLLPERSLLLSHPMVRAHLGSFDPGRLGYAWDFAHEAVGRLWSTLAREAEESAVRRRPTLQTYERMRAVAHLAAGREAPAPLTVKSGAIAGRPRMTEPWFC